MAKSGAGQLGFLQKHSVSCEHYQRIQTRQSCRQDKRWATFAITNDKGWTMNKKDRQLVFEKTNGHCAYCGKELAKGWHLDHIKPIWRNNPTVNEAIRGTDTVDNAFATCPRCNNWKSVHSLERFREEIGKQGERLRRDSASFRLAEDYGQVTEMKRKPVVFYFETMDSH
jgi:5-methylcytosine-specific restriction endonuclease McrA